ncbi:uncharacterized protein LOC124922607 [Impatiens glandulifera]|uniref:uncharacterized protein LOC124922607 n=1 Tax=Impatiens glandulifera TaxID=253017 RepID=UPI001FB10C8F|nr:uncharacterized protein LOC124922607 [Impatiens glandulifera]
MGETDKKLSGVKNSIIHKIHGSILVSEKYDSNSIGDRDDEDNVTEALLPARKGGLSKKSGKPNRKVQWNDINGNKLAEVKEFQPSDDSDSDEDDSDYCMCTIM